MTYLEWASWVALAIIGLLVAGTLFVVIVIATRPRRLVRALDNRDKVDRVASFVGAVANTSVLIALLLVLLNAHLDTVALFVLGVVLIAEEYHRMRRVPLRPKPKPFDRPYMRTGVDPRSTEDWEE